MAKKQTIMTPDEAAGEVDPVDLDSARAHLARAVKESKGRAFTYAADLFPDGTASILIAELRKAKWTVTLVPDSRDGDYYDIKPRR